MVTAERGRSSREQPATGRDRPRTPPPGNVRVGRCPSRATESDAGRFDRPKDSLVFFLVQVEGVSLERGCLMDVFGRDGSLLHRLDART